MHLKNHPGSTTTTALEKLDIESRAYPDGPEKVDQPIREAILRAEKATPFPVVEDELGEPLHSGAQAIRYIYNLVLDSNKPREELIANADRFNKGGFIITLDDEGNHVVLEGDFEAALGSTPLLTVPSDLAEIELGDLSKNALTVLVPRWQPPATHPDNRRLGGSHGFRAKVEEDHPRYRIQYDVYAWNERGQALRLEQWDHDDFNKLDFGERLQVIISKM